MVKCINDGTKEAECCSKCYPDLADEPCDSDHYCTFVDWDYYGGVQVAGIGLTIACVAISVSTQPFISTWYILPTVVCRSSLFVSDALLLCQFRLSWSSSVTSRRCGIASAPSTSSPARTLAASSRLCLLLTPPRPCRKPRCRSKDFSKCPSKWVRKMTG